MVSGEGAKMHTILGAGGAIGRELVRQLSGRGLPVRLVRRTIEDLPSLVQGVSADLLDRQQTTDAVSGSIVYLLAGLRYDAAIRKRTTPGIRPGTSRPQPRLLRERYLSAWRLKRSGRSPNAGFSAAPR